MKLCFPFLRPHATGIESLQLLEETSQTSPLHRPLDVQIAYCEIWCRFSKFLWEHRHKPKWCSTTEPLSFSIPIDEEGKQMVVTDCYWMEVIFNVWHLSFNLLMWLKQQELDRRITANQLQWDEMESKFTVDCVSRVTCCIGILNYVVRQALWNYPTLKKKYPNVASSLSNRLELLKAYNAWLRGNYHFAHEGWVRAVFLYNRCVCFLEQNPAVSSHPLMQGLKRSAMVHILLAKARYQETQHNSVGVAVLLRQARITGWKPTKEDEAKMVFTDSNPVPNIEALQPLVSDSPAESAVELGAIHLDYTDEFEFWDGWEPPVEPEKESVILNLPSPPERAIALEVNPAQEPATTVETVEQIISE